MEEAQDKLPLLSAVSSSARQLFLLLRCINFASKAQVQISAAGMRFTVEESSVMEGMAFLSKDLFTSYTYNAPSPSTPQDTTTTTASPNPDTSTSTPDPSTTTPFEISLPSLLETLQILGLDLPPTRPWNSTHPTTAFDTRALGITGLCRLRYDSPGSTLEITLTESTLTTTCSLTTYEPRAVEDIPFSRQALGLKLITRASVLHDALSELSATSPDTLTLTASPTSPFFSLSATGPLGSAVVEFGSKDKALLETFMVADGRRKVVQSYRFALVKAAMRACACAAKVSIRMDEQGVLSLQFMIEVEGEMKVSFVDFRCVPLVEEEGLREDEDEDGSDEEEGEEGDEEGTGDERGDA